MHQPNSMQNSVAYSLMSQESNPKVRIESMIREYELNPDFRKAGDQSFGKFAKFSEKLARDYTKKYHGEYRPSGSQINQKFNSFGETNDNTSPKDRPAQIAFLDEPAKVTIAATSAAGCSLVSYQLRPILVGIQYFFQSVDDYVDEAGTRSVKVNTRDESGTVVASQPVALELCGTFYENYIKEKDVVDRIYDIDQLEKLTLSVRNERGEVVAELPIVLPNSKHDSM